MEKFSQPADKNGHVLLPGGGHHHKVLMNPKHLTLDPFKEWLNFMFKYSYIYLKNGASLLLNQWFL